MGAILPFPAQRLVARQRLLIEGGEAGMITVTPTPIPVDALFRRVAAFPTAEQARGFAGALLLLSRSPHRPANLPRLAGIIDLVPLSRGRA